MRLTGRRAQHALATDIVDAEVSNPLPERVRERGPRRRILVGAGLRPGAVGHRDTVSAGRGCPANTGGRQFPTDGWETWFPFALLAVDGGRG